MSKSSISKRRVNQLLKKKQELISEKRRLLHLQQKIKDGTAKIVNGEIVTIPYPMDDKK